MLSGVGPADQLAAHSIRAVRDLSGVGAHLMDHPVVETRYRDKSKGGLNFVPSSSGPKFGSLWDVLRWEQGL
jgi:choline dehydrogenase